MARTHEKVLARVIAKDYLKNTRGNVLRILEDQGVFRKPFDQDLYSDILPWMYDNTWMMMEENKSTDNILHELVGSAVDFVVGEHGASLDKQRKKKEKKRNEEEEKKETKKLEKERKRIEMIEKKRIEELKMLDKKIEQQLIVKGETKNEILKQECVEITGNYQSTSSVCVPGGLLTELVIALASAFELSPNKDWMNENNIYKFLVLYISDKMGCPQFSVYLGPNINQFLTAKGIKLDTLHTMDAQTEKEFLDLYKLAENNDFIQKIIRDKSAEYDLDPKIFDLVYDSILKILIKKQSEKESQGN